MFSKIVVVEEEGLLGHDRDLVEEGAAFDVAQIDAVDLDRAAGRVVEAQHQIDQRRLARAGSADDGDDLAGRDREVDAREHRLLAVVEVHVAKADLGRALGHRPRVRPIGDLRLHVEQVEEPRCAAGRLHDARVGRRDRLDRLVDREQDQRELHQRPDRHAPHLVQHQPDAEADDPEAENRVQQLARRLGQHGVPDHLHVTPEVFARLDGEGGLLELLALEGLDDLDAGEDARAGAG